VSKSILLQCAWRHTILCCVQHAKYPKLQENLSADVCVIGAGISGLSIAYNLVKAGAHGRNAHAQQDPLQGHVCTTVDICHCTTSAYCRFQMYELCKVI